MGTVLSLLKKFEELDTGIIAVQSIEETADEMADKNKDQLLHGFNSSGELIGDTKPYQSADYAFEKYNKNPLPGLGNPDLKDEGSFYAGIRIEVSGAVIKTESTDSKNEELEAKYKGALGLNKESKVEYIKESLRPVFFKKIKEKVKL